MATRYGMNQSGALVPVKVRKPKTPEAKRAARQRHRSPVGSGGFSGKELRRLGDSCDWCCHWCGVSCKDNYHVDHIQPLSKGGSNRIENICISCPPCNLKKGAKLVGSDEKFDF